MLRHEFSQQMLLPPSKNNLPPPSASIPSTRGEPRHTNLIIHIRNIHNEIDLELEIIPQYPPQYINTNIVPRMAQMGVIVDSWAAGVPRDFLPGRVERYEGFF